MIGAVQWGEVSVQSGIELLAGIGRSWGGGVGLIVACVMCSVL